MFMSCVEEKDVFIPIETNQPISELKKFIPSSSISRTLSNQESHVLISQNGNQITIEENIINDLTESYQFNYIELLNYKDYILHNLDYSTATCPVDALMSFYLGTETESGSPSFSNGRSVKVRIALENDRKNIKIGQGSFESGVFRWNYNIPTLNDYSKDVEWLVSDGEGSYRTVRGIELTIHNAGWYSIVDSPDVDFENNELCVSYTEVFNPDNTVAFLMSEGHNYIHQFKLQTNVASHCTPDIPVREEDSYMLLSISLLDDTYYIFETQLSDFSEEVIINPEPISKDALRAILESL